MPVWNGRLQDESPDDVRMSRETASGGNGFRFQPKIPGSHSASRRVTAARPVHPVPDPEADVDPGDLPQRGNIEKAPTATAPNQISG